MTSQNPNSVSTQSESTTQNDKIRNILAKFSQLDSNVDSSIPQPLKNPKADVSHHFFLLIDQLSDYFSVYSLPSQQNRLFFASSALLHHYAMNLYITDFQFNDHDFTSEWKHFSAIFSMFESSLFPSDFSSAIEQIRLYLLPLKSSIEPEDEIMSKLNSFMSNFSQIQDSLGTVEEYNHAISEFSALQHLIELFLRKTHQSSPHLVNALNYTDYILTYGQRFFYIRDLIKVINEKLRNSEIITIKNPESADDNRRFLLNSFKFLQTENRIIFDNINNQIFPTESELLYKKYRLFGKNSFCLSSSTSCQIISLISLNFDCSISKIWIKYLQKLEELHGSSALEFPSKNEDQASFSLCKVKQISEKDILDDFELQVSQNLEERHVMVLFEEFDRLYIKRIETDTSFTSLNVISYCFHLLFQIINETKSPLVEESAKATMECVICRLLISKIDYDHHKMGDIIEILDIKSRMDNKSLNEKFLESLKSLQVAAAKINAKFLDPSAEEIPVHRIFMNYCRYLALLVSILDSKGTTDDDFELVKSQYLQYHLDPRIIAKSLSYFFQRLLREYLSSAVGDPPIILSSLDSITLTPEELHSISSLLISEKLRAVDSQYILCQHITFCVFLTKISSFLEAFYPEGLNESPKMINDSNSNQTYKLFSNLLTFSNFLTDGSDKYRFSHALFPLFVLVMYKSGTNKIELLTTLTNIIQNMIIPMSSDLLMNILNKIETCQYLQKQIKPMNSYLNKLMQLLANIFVGKFDCFSKANNELDFRKSTDVIVREAQKLDIDEFLINDLISIPGILEKFIYPYMLLARIGDSLKRYPLLSNLINPTSLRDENDQKDKADLTNTSNNNEIQSQGQKEEDYKELNQEENPTSVPNISKVQNESYYEALLLKFNFLTLIRNNIHEAIKEELISEDDDCYYDCVSLKEQIDEHIADTHFMKLNIKEMDNINFEFLQTFDADTFANNLLDYFEKWAVWALNINHLTSDGNLITIKFIKEIKKILSELKDNPRQYFQLNFIINKLNQMIKAPKSLDQQMFASICQPLIKKFRIAQNYAVLKKYAVLNYRYLVKAPVNEDLTQIGCESSDTNQSQRENEQNLQLQNSVACIIELIKALPHNSYLQDVLDAAAEMVTDEFKQHCDSILSATPESVNKMEYSHFKSLKTALRCRINSCKIGLQKPDFPSIDEYFERYLKLIKSQSSKKNEAMKQLKDTLIKKDNELRQLHSEFNGDGNTHSIEIKSALASILEDELFSNFGKPIPINQPPISGDEEVDSCRFELPSYIPTNEADSIINSLLEKLKESEILNARLRRRIDQSHLPSGKPFDPQRMINAYSLGLDRFEGQSWVLKNVKQSSEKKKQLEKLEKERSELFMQTVRQNKQYNAPLQQQVVENYYAALMSATKNALQNNPPNGKVSKSTFLTYVEKSDAFFTYIDYDIRTIRQRLDEYKNPNRLLPKAFIEQFNRKLQSQL